MAAFDYTGYYDLPPPLVDNPHERHHQHQSLVSYLARRHPRPEDYPNRPDVDIRDAIKEYLVEVELPGIKTPEEFTVTWTGHRALVLSGKVDRPDYGVAENAKVEEEQPVASAGGVHLLVGERRVGPFRRYINFPTEVENVNVTLEAGILKIRAPKKGFSEISNPPVEVKHDEHAGRKHTFPQIFNSFASAPTAPPPT